MTKLYYGYSRSGNNMKILYDHSVFQFQRYGGISRYFYELITRLSAKEDVGINLFQGFHVNEYDLSNHKLNFESYLGYKWKYKIPDVKYMSHIFAIPNKILFNTIYMRSGNYDIYHPTYYRKDLDKHKKSTIVLTVHDMIHELYPGQFRDSRSVIKSKKISINTADVIICVSENTKNDLINLYDVPDDKIKVIYHGNSLPKSDEYLKYAYLEKKYLITKPYILYVGDRKGSYKNFPILLETYSTMLSDHFDLVCFGGGEFNRNELRAIKNIRYLGKVIHLSGSDYLLASLYKNAFCFIYPSLYEGFGIPPLEAMGMGCPVIASNTSSIPEVVDKAALLFNPNSKDSLINAIELLESNELKREELINLGFEQEKKFSWDKTAEETFKVYEHASDLKH